MFTPKSLLRHKRVYSSLAEMATGTSFHRVLWDDADVGRDGRRADKVRLKPDKDIRRVVLCTGKVYYDLFEARETKGIEDVYLLRVEQLYPFPARSLIAELTRFAGADVVWCQEEPRNMGSWTFIEPNLEWVLEHVGGKMRRPRYVGRAAAASTATGQASRHNAEQQTLVDEALAP